MDIKEINNLGYEEFTDTLEGVLESFPTLVAGLWSRRPFTNIQHLHYELCSIIDALPFEGMYNLLNRLTSAILYPM